MKAESKKYLSKRQKIVDTITAIDVEYEDWRNEIFTSSKPDETTARKAAEEILSKFGVNKPKEIEYH